MGEYRIVQTGDNTFIVEKTHHSVEPGKWPWSAPVTVSEWRPALGFPGHPYPFPSLERAEKWLNDHRKYPIVVKHPA
jgi:hypothetical protein